MAITKIQFCEEAQEIFNKNGLTINMSIDYGYDRREFFPDETHYTIAKDGEVIFSYSEMGTKKLNRKGPEGEFGTEAINACLDCASGTRYLEQSRAFKRKLSELLELRKNHKFSKFGEKKELKADCEKLCTYNYSGSYSTGEPNFTINVPLMEDNRELLTQVSKELETIKASIIQKSKSEQPDKTTSQKNEQPEEAGPQNG